MFFIFLAIHDYQFFNSDEQEIQNIKKQLFLRHGNVKFMMVIISLFRLSSKKSAFLHQ